MAIGFCLEILLNTNELSIDMNFTLEAQHWKIMPRSSGQKVGIFLQKKLLLLGGESFFDHPFLKSVFKLMFDGFWNNTVVMVLLQQ